MRTRKGRLGQDRRGGGAMEKGTPPLPATLWGRNRPVSLDNDPCSVCLVVIFCFPVPATFINWNSTRRRSCLLDPTHVFSYLFISRGTRGR